MTNKLTASDISTITNPYQNRYYDPELGSFHAVPLYNVHDLVRDAILINEQKRGTITITKDKYGLIVAVTRTDDEGKILEVIAEGKSVLELRQSH